jgi:hypothetical protein
LYAFMLNLLMRNELLTHIDSILPMYFNKNFLCSEIHTKMSKCIQDTNSTIEVSKSFFDIVKDMLFESSFPIGDFPQLMASAAFKFVTHDYHKPALDAMAKCIKEQSSETDDIEIDDNFKDYQSYVNPHLHTNAAMEEGLRYAYTRIVDDLYELPFTDISMTYCINDKTWQGTVNYAKNQITGLNAKNTKSKKAIIDKLFQTKFEDLLDEVASGFSSRASIPVDIEVTICKTINETVTLFYKLTNVNNGELIGEYALFLDMSLAYVLTPAITVDRSQPTIMVG